MTPLDCTGMVSFGLDDQAELLLVTYDGKMPHLDLSRTTDKYPNCGKQALRDLRERSCYRKSIHSEESCFPSALQPVLRFLQDCLPPLGSVISQL
jgi:hypothetical protein